MKHSATPSLPQPQQQPVSILRRSSTGGAASSKYTTSFNNNNNSFHGDVNNSHLSLNSSAPNLNSNSNSNFTPITDPNELADRLLGFKHSYARSSSAGGNNVATAYQSPISVRRHRSPPRATPPLPLRPTSSGRPRSQLMSPSAKDPDPKHNQQHRRNSDKSWSDAAEEEDYVRRMDRIKLDKSDRSIRGSASSSEYCFDGFQSEEMNASSTPTPPNCDKNGRCKLHPQYKLYKKKLLGGYEFISSCPMCFAASLDELHTTSAKSPSASSKMSGRNSNRTTHSRERGRSTSANRMPIDPGLDEDDNYYGTSIRGRPQTRLGNSNHSTASAKSPAATMSRRRSSRSRERGRSKSANRTPIVPNLDLDEGDDYATSKAKADHGLMRSGRVKSVEQLHHLGEGEERQRRSRTRSPHDRSKDVHGKRSSNISSRGKSLTRALGNIRDKLTTHMPSSVNLPQELRHRSRSRSRGARRMSSDKEQSLDDGMSLGNGLRALDKDNKRRSSRDKASASYAGRSNQKSDLGSNPFVHESSKVNFDKKTGRCKKHPSVIIAKKSTFRPGSWEMIKKNGCPLCLKANVDSERDEVGQDLDKDTKRKMDSLLKGDRDVVRDSPLSRPKKAEVRSNSTASKQHVIDSIPEGLRNKNVSRMLYTTPMGETGWYTGEVDVEGNPDGFGRMRLKTGHSFEGEWSHGCREDLNLIRMKSGFTTNKASPRK